MVLSYAYAKVNFENIVVNTSFLPHGKALYINNCVIWWYYFLCAIAGRTGDSICKDPLSRCVYKRGSRNENQPDRGTSTGEWFGSVWLMYTYPTDNIDCMEYKLVKCTFCLSVGGRHL